MVSVIVPVYNTERYLQECIDSILSQTYTDFQLLLVNDGSTDKSGVICDEYALKDSRIHVYHKENGGVSSARNLGLKNAKGEWICFVDSDDVIEKDYLEVLLKTAVVNEADSSIGGFRYLGSLKNVEVVHVEDGVESVEDNIKDFYACKAPDWQRYLWNRLFSMDVIRKYGLRFNEKLYFKEDGLFVVQFLCASNGKVGVTIRVVYNYRQNTDSAMGGLGTAFNPKLLTNSKGHNLIVKTLRRHGYSQEVLQLALAHAKQSTEWAKGIMYSSGCRRLDYRIRLEMLLMDTLGIVEYLYYKKEQYG